MNLYNFIYRLRWINRSCTITLREPIDYFQLRLVIVTSTPFIRRLFSLIVHYRTIDNWMVEEKSQNALQILAHCSFCKSVLLKIRSIRNARGFQMYKTNKALSAFFFSLFISCNSNLRKRLRSFRLASTKFKVSHIHTNSRCHKKVVKCNFD